MYTKNTSPHTKHWFWGVAFLLLIIVSCDKYGKDGRERVEPFQTYTIASKRSFVDMGETCYKVYYTKNSTETAWNADIYWLDGLDYQDGIEYSVIGAKAVLHTYSCNTKVDIQGLIIQRIVSKNNTESPNLPENKWYWDPSWDEGYNPFWDQEWFEQNT